MDDISTEPRFHPTVQRAKNSLRGKSQIAIANKLYFDAVQKSLHEHKAVRRFQHKYAYEVNEALSNQTLLKVHSKVLNNGSDYLQPLDELQNDLKRFDYKTSSIFQNKRYPILCSCLFISLI